MSEQVHLAFIILAPGGTSTNARSDSGFTLTLATVDTIEAAVQFTRNLTGQGVTNIELSAGFGDDGLAEIRKVAGTGVRVGRVRYEP